MIIRLILSGVIATGNQHSRALLQVWLVEALVELLQEAYMVSALQFLSSGVIPQVSNLHIHVTKCDFLQE